MISLLNDFACVLRGYYCSDNICHIHHTCIHSYECSCGDSVHAVMKTVCHIEYMKTFLQCVSSCEWSNVLMFQMLSHTLCTNTDSKCMVSDIINISFSFRVHTVVNVDEMTSTQDDHNRCHHTWTSKFFQVRRHGITSLTIHHLGHTHTSNQSHAVDSVLQ